MNRPLVCLALGSLLAGCGAPEEGTAPKPVAPPTQAQIDAMPAQERGMVESAQKGVDAESRRMAEAAEAMRKAKGGN
ncbi:hypothetical protein EON81_06495 [bacterium]|nr:MAG: hypothetical protein EON81_06495 [bacterium]